MILDIKNFQRNSKIFSFLNAFGAIFSFVKNLLKGPSKELIANITTNFVFPILTTGADSKIKCNSCKICEEACPTKSIKIQENKNNNIEFLIDYSRCLSCYQCQEVCPVDAIRLSERNKFMGRVDKKLILCQKNLAFAEDINGGKGIESLVNKDIPNNYF